MINFASTNFTDLHELLEWKKEVDRLVEIEKEKASEEKALLNIDIVPDTDKDFLRRSLISKWLKNCSIEEFEKSEETDSGVFGVHIVFERKKEV